MSFAKRVSRQFIVLSAATVPLLLASCQADPVPGPSAASQRGPATGPTAWLTTADREHLLSPGNVLPAAPAGSIVLEVAPEQRFQSMVGFGGAITEGSAWLIRHGLSDQQRQSLMQELFGHGKDDVSFGITRLTIGASDFSRSHYSLDDMPPGGADLALEHFSLEPEQEDVIPVVKEALAKDPRLMIIASPWSAPAWMKTNDNLVTGHLRPDRYDAFARYLVRYVDEMKRAGVPVAALTVQNEPHFEPKDYPGMRLEPAVRAELVGKHLGPLLKAHDPSVQLLEWDHNWKEPESPLQVLADPVARAYLSGVAWHCYEGDPSAQSVVHDAHPELDVWLTECTGGDWKPDWAETLPWMMHNLVIGGTRNGARGVVMWNIALDPEHGPHLGGCKDCRGMVTIDPRTGAVTRNMEYYAFAHASKFVQYGAIRIGSTSGLDGLDTVAFRNPDNSTVLVVSNGAPDKRVFAVHGGGADFSYDLPASAVVTFKW